MDVVSNVSDQTHVVQSTRGLGKKYEICQSQS
jgi:hypothetical protein